MRKTKKRLFYSFLVSIAPLEDYDCSLKSGSIGTKFGELTLHNSSTIQLVGLMISKVDIGLGRVLSVWLLQFQHITVLNFDRRSV